MRMRWTWAASFLVALLATGGTVRAGTSATPDREGLRLALSAFGSLAGDLPRRSNNAAGFGFSLRVGWRGVIGAPDGPAMGVFGECSRDRWVAAETQLKVVSGVFNAGMGAELLLFGDRVRMALSAGTSTLLFDAAFHSAGSTGFYVDIQPASLRWPIGRRAVLELLPIGAVVLVPGTGNPLLRRLEYRTAIGFEVPF